MPDRRTDAELIAATCREPAAFGAFYERHEVAVLVFLLRRTGDPELAADLAAETFAQALLASRRFKDDGPPAIAWLLGIARNVLAMSMRKGRVEAKARRRLGMERLELDDRDIERIQSLDSDPEVLRRLEALPREQREAIMQRVVEERSYTDVAARLGCSEQVARKRVSRGLAELRARLESTT